MEKILKEKINDFYRLISIKEDIDNRKLSNISYVYLRYNDNKTPMFGVENVSLNLTKEIRDSKIDEVFNKKNIFNFDTEVCEINVEELIFTKEQLLKLENIRNQKPIGDKYVYPLKKAKFEYANGFKIGDKVYFKGHYGSITYKHNMNKDIAQEYTVLIGNKEYRYVSGTLLKIRTTEKISIKEDKKIDRYLESLTTERLLKMYKRSLKVGKGHGDRRIKSILNNREHIGKVKEVIKYR